MTMLLKHTENFMIVFGLYLVTHQDFYAAKCHQLLNVELQKSSPMPCSHKSSLKQYHMLHNVIGMFAQSCFLSSKKSHLNRQLKLRIRLILLSLTRRHRGSGNIVHVSYYSSSYLYLSYQTMIQQNHGSCVIRMNWARITLSSLLSRHKLLSKNYEPVITFR